ncbi:MAG: HAMP domain-containing histidine kinase [Oscillospiraceae bacterium]|nr:HAMP domain-containing histidine kinase [Oscillospiraceae bacterium]
MEERNQTAALLQLMPQPAFLVEKGVISHINTAAAAYFLQAGQDVMALLQSGAEEYAEFTQGTLYLTLSLCDQPVGACVTRLECGDIFTLEQAEELPQLQAMALAAAQMREPLTGLLSLTDQMLPAITQENAELQTQAAQMNRRLYQLLRIVSNMSDAATYSQSQTVSMESVEICGLLEEIFEKTATLAQSTGISLEYSLPREVIFALVDTERLERAIYNLLSNAIKFASPGSVVRAALVCKQKRLHISVTNDHPGPQGNLFSRFLREPALEDPRNGVGLGMVLVKSTAAQHGGCVLVDRLEDGTRVTLTLPIRQADTSNVRSPIMRIDYAGERDHCLMELSDVLPAEAYRVDQIN